MVTAKEFKSGKQLEGSAVFVDKPVILVNKENVILHAGTEEDVLDTVTRYGSYYDDCTVEYRQCELYMNRNERVVNKNNVENAKKNFGLWLFWHPYDFAGAVQFAGDYLDVEEDLNQFEKWLRGTVESALAMARRK